jgi:D-tyrosyl-tRNA(Tyr) deacylase
MKLVIQRVSHARVTVSDRPISEIGSGLLLLIGIDDGDVWQAIEASLEKIVTLRCFTDERGKMNYSLLDTGGSLMLVSQFTLCADLSSGRRPSFTGAAPPDSAEQLYNRAITWAQQRLGEGRVAAGEFGAEMAVELTNDGPVTFITSI